MTVFEIPFQFIIQFKNVHLHTCCKVMTANINYDSPYSPKNIYHQKIFSPRYPVAASWVVGMFASRARDRGSIPGAGELLRSFPRVLQ